jgi:predicted alpha/beta-fold hydrolase
MSFTPAWWLRNPHAQTLWAPLFRKRPDPHCLRERVELPDGDFVDLFWHGARRPGRPLVLVLHGLTGSADSPYIRGLQHTLKQRGLASVAMHFRGAGLEPNHVARMYHSGDTADLDFIVRSLRQRGYANLMVAGFSLGGNVLLKWLGEQGDKAGVRRAVAVSVPFRLEVVAETLNQGASKLYRNHMLGELKATVRRKLEWARQSAPDVHQQLANLGNVDRHQRFRDYDHEVVAPLNGFGSAEDYYEHCSSRRFLPSVTVPTLIIHALDDPLMTPDVVPSPSELPVNVTLEVFERGGHVGFVSGANPFKPVYWLDGRIADYFTEPLSPGRTG